MADPVKKAVNNLGYFGSDKLFEKPRSIGSLYKPNFDTFIEYSSVFFNAKRYTNNGFLVRELEKRLADFHRTTYCITFSSAFWGLALAIKYLALPGKSEVIMPSLTYRRMGDIAALAGYIPRYCDVEIETLAQSRNTTEQCINNETALIIGAHPTINCCDVDGLERLSYEHSIPLIFDSVESVYETYKGKKVGSFGEMEAFSIHSTKLINGFEGGYITTNNEDLYNHLKYARAFEFKAEDEVATFGFNAKLNEIHAAMALTSLDGLQDLVEANRQRYIAYKRELSSIKGLKIVEFDESEQTSFKNILIEITDSWPLTRSRTISILHAENLLARPYYFPALHTKPAGFEYRYSNLPNSERLSEKYILFPCGHQVTPDDVVGICGLLKFIEDNSSEIERQLDDIE